jgi:anaerobic selenocysteine-containing dehydrogenase
LPFYHSEHRQVKSARKMHPDPLMQINPKIAEKYGISEGDWVWIESPRGKVKQRCQILEGIDPRVVHAQHGWWFPEMDGTTAEVFFNYNQYDGRGEFSEKDPGYRKDLVSLLAIFLRDGVPPPRTPASDPNLTDKGPHFESFSDLSKQVRFIGFSQSGRRRF